MLMTDDLANYTQKILQADKGKQLFFGFIFTGLLIKIGLSFAAAASALLWGYFIIIFSIIGLLFLKVDPSKNNTTAVKLLLHPLLLLIIILLWNISITLRFFDQINQKTVPTQYFMWSWFSTILIVSIIVSQFFWKNPIKNSILHKIDSIIAKIVIILFIFYTLIYKFKYDNTINNVSA